MEKKKSKPLSHHKKPEWKTTRSLNFKPKKSEFENKKTWTHFYTLGKYKKTEWQNNVHKKVEWKIPKIQQRKSTMYQRPQKGKYLFQAEDLNEANVPYGQEDHDQEKKETLT